MVAMMVAMMVGCACQ